MIALNSLNRVVFLVMVIVLCSAIALILLPVRVDYHYRLNKPLATWMPTPLLGWSVVELKIADTPEMKQAVADQLNFSDAIYLSYRSGKREINVYVAYWEPSKMDPRLIGVHSPDVCWGGSGWQRIGERKRLTVSGSVEGGGLLNGHFRNFLSYGNKVDVVFWHFVGGVQSRYLESGGPNLGWWTPSEIFRNPLGPRYEQFFVRISTSGDMDDVSGDPMMRRIVDVLSVVQAAEGLR